MPNISVDESCTCLFCRRNDSFNGWNEPEDDYEDNDEYSGDGYYSDDSSLLSYSYRPHFVMHGDRPPYYGFELEHTCSRISKAVQIVTAGSPPNLLYMKEDGSVDGYEMVTHPMTWEWLMANFPWGIIDELRDSARATVYEQGNGLHVHVSRNSFGGPAHLYRWMKLWYRNQDEIKALAGRDCSWGRFTRDHRKAQIFHAKKMAGVRGDRNYYRNDELDTTVHQRYAAINTMNRDTLEVRVFASSTDPQIVKGRLGLVAASVDYTSGLTANQVCLSQGWEFGSFMNWVAKQEGKYEPLEKFYKMVN